jgi:hypothetical protein
VVAAGAAGRGPGRGGVGILGMAAGRGAPGAAPCAITGSAGVLTASPRPGGRGWRGPERICPGFGAGTGLAGMGVPRAASGGVTGAPPADARGGRKGDDGREDRARSSGVSRSTSLGAVSLGASGSIRAAACGRAGSDDGAAGVSTCGTVSADSAIEGAAPLPPPRCRRTSSTTSSSSELEWVFFSVTPSSGSSSMITLGLTSSSRASSLMRTLLIESRPGAKSFRNAGVSDSSPFPVRALT